MGESLKSGQLEVYCSEDSGYLPVEAKEVVWVGIALDAGVINLIDAEWGIEMINELIPGFSKQPRCTCTTAEAKTATEGVDIITRRALERALNAVIIPSVDLLPQMANMVGVPRSQFAIGVLTSVPQGRRPQVYLVEGVGDSGKAAIQRVVRVRAEPSVSHQLAQLRSLAFIAACFLVIGCFMEAQLWAVMMGIFSPFSIAGVVWGIVLVVRRQRLTWAQYGFVILALGICLAYLAYILVVALWIAKAGHL